MGDDYQMLTEVIGMEGFSYEHYIRDEVEVLQPRLEELGYTDISWGPGESDSFGPLTRVCKTYKDWHKRLFMYG